MGRSRLETLQEQLEEPLSGALGSLGPPGQVELLTAPKSVADDTTKLRVRDRAGRPVAVVLIASERSPDLVARGVGRAREAREALGPELGSAVLQPLADGHLPGDAVDLSYMILPWHRPLSEARLLAPLQRRALAPHLLEWLRGVAEVSRCEPDPAEIESDFVAALRHVAELPPMDARLRRGAERALERLAAGQWQPRYVLAHNDLWTGNVLLAAGAGRIRPRHFVVIDWPGSLLRGHGLFDLLRCARSFSVPRARLAGEIARHCELLGCEPGDAASHVLAAIGRIGLCLEHMPPDLYRRMAAATVAALDEAAPQRDA